MYLQSTNSSLDVLLVFQVLDLNEKILRKNTLDIFFFILEITLSTDSVF